MELDNGEIDVLCCLEGIYDYSFFLLRKIRVLLLFLRDIRVLLLFLRNIYEYSLSLEHRPLETSDTTSMAPANVGSKYVRAVQVYNVVRRAKMASVCRSFCRRRHRRYETLNSAHGTVVSLTGPTGIPASLCFVEANERPTGIPAGWGVFDLLTGHRIGERLIFTRFKSAACHAPLFDLKIILPVIIMY